jgi:hypothetical protein
MQMTFIELARWASICFGTLSAVFWFWAAAARSPRKMMTVYGGPGPIQDLADAVRKQSLLNGYGAISAAIAMFAQALALAFGG